MSLRWIQRIEQDEDYYISNNYSTESISDLIKDIGKAVLLLKEYEQRLVSQYNTATRTVEYRRIIATRYKDEYRDKKVKVNISVEKYYILDGEEVRHEVVYGKSKQFAYSDMKEAIKYINELMNESTSTYINKTPYSKLNI